MCTSHVVWFTAFRSVHENMEVLHIQHQFTRSGQVHQSVIICMALFIHSGVQSASMMVKTRRPSHSRHTQIHTHTHTLAVTPETWPGTEARDEEEVKRQVTVHDCREGAMAGAVHGKHPHQLTRCNSQSGNST